MHYLHDVFIYSWVISLFIAIFFEIRATYFSGIIESHYKIELPGRFFWIKRARTIARLRETTDSKELRRVSSKYLDSKAWIVTFFAMAVLLLLLRIFLSTVDHTVHI
jgi:hypothetical protein